MVITHTAIDARMQFCAALPHNDIACANLFAAVTFNTQPLRIAVAAIP
jgi:hypothetical protein